jgi:hypothetical protein
MPLTTRDLALAIRDHLEDRPVSGFVEHNGELIELPDRHFVDFVDVADPDNITVRVGLQTFTLSIRQASSVDQIRRRRPSCLFIEG